MESAGTACKKTDENEKIVVMIPKYESSSVISLGEFSPLLVSKVGQILHDDVYVFMNRWVVKTT